MAPIPASCLWRRDTVRGSVSWSCPCRWRCAVSPLRLLVLVVLGSVLGLAATQGEASGQATPVAPPGVTARTTALLVSAIPDPLRVTGSDGMVHLEYDLVLTNVFTAPVTITAIEVLTPDGQSLLRLEGDPVETMTQPLFRRVSRIASPTTLRRMRPTLPSSAAMRLSVRSWRSIPSRRWSSPRPCAAPAGSTPTAAALPRPIARP